MVAGHPLNDHPSRPGKGASVRPPSALRTAGESLEESTRGGKVTKILVVDDDPVVRLLMQECLVAHGFEVSALESGRACLDTLTDTSLPLPDLVVLDLLMPEMTGVEVLRKLKGTPELARLPVIMLSAHQDTAKVIGAGAVLPDGILQKPFNLKEVLAIMQSYRAGVKPESGPA
jgi:CheY-like chemotaxis protein